MILGKTIRDIEHAIRWCIEEKRWVALATKNGTHPQSNKFIANLPLNKLLNYLRAGKIKELHSR